MVHFRTLQRAENLLGIGLYQPSQRQFHEHTEGNAVTEFGF